MQALAAVQQHVDDLAPMPAEIGLQQPEAAEPEQDRQRNLREPVPPADAFIQQLQPVAQDLGRAGWIERHGWEGLSLQIVAGLLPAYRPFTFTCLHAAAARGMMTRTSRNGVTLRLHAQARRSEERRVGKECRSRWS